MKKKFHIITILCSILILGSVAFGQSDIQVYVNNQKIVFPDASPYVANNRTLVPVRFIAESLGANVDWSQSNQEVTITKDSKQIVLKIGEKIARVGDKVIELDTNADIKDSRTFVPLRFISETFDAKVEWVQETRTVLINTGTESTENDTTWIKPIDSVIKNKELIYSDMIKNAKLVDKYKYDLELFTSENQLFIKSNVDAYAMVFIKDDTIVHSVFPMISQGITYIPIDFELDEYDYFGIYEFRTEDMELIPNTFKK